MYLQNKYAGPKSLKSCVHHSIVYMSKLDVWVLQHGQSHQLQHAHTAATYYEGVERLPGAANDSSAPAETSGQSHLMAFDGAGPTAGSVLTMASSAGSDWKVGALVALYAIQ